MSAVEESTVKRRARSHIARRRGTLIGAILIGLGAWGALIPFVGPYFHYAYTPEDAWRWTASRGWLEILPGVGTALGGLIVMISNSRTATVLGAWLAVVAGAWFAIGTSLQPVLHTGTLGTPAGSNTGLRSLEAVGFFYGLGVVIVFFAATASGRLSVRSPADIHNARRELNQQAEARIHERHVPRATPVTPARTDDVEAAPSRNSKALAEQAPTTKSGAPEPESDAIA